MTLKELEIQYRAFLKASEEFYQAEVVYQDMRRNFMRTKAAFNEWNPSNPTESAEMFARVNRELEPTKIRM